MGGLPAGEVERSQHDYSDWERRVDAMSVLLGAKKLLTVDHRRRNIEALAPEAYDAMSYYERWVASLGMSLIQRGIITTQELARKMLEVERRGFHDMGGESAGQVDEAKFKPGERVRVLKAYPLGHVRTPFYIRGCTGTVERICGAFPNPEELAQMRDGLPPQPLYRVRFLQNEVWPDYRGSPSDVVEVEIFQHWLESA